jgi:hypothetical protein
MVNINSSRKKTTTSSSKLRKTNSRKTRKNVRINLSENVMRSYSLDSIEKKNKKRSPSSFPKCSQPLQFPCAYKGGIFENLEEWETFTRMLRSKNVSTKLKSVKDHYRDVKSKLVKENKYKKTIPAEYRLYNEDTGEIIDLRTYYDSK